MSESEQKRDVYQIITNRIIEQLELGLVPWKQSWTEAGTPRNLLTKKLYNGINVLLLAFLNYEQNCFLTFNQLKKIGGSVIKGEKSHPVVFWKWPEPKKDATPEEKEKKRKPVLRYYLVFNIAQCEGIPVKFLPKMTGRENEPIYECEDIVHNMPNCPDIIHEEPHPFYHRVKDFINIPKMNSFQDIEGYYKVLFHEMIHSTGHTSRLNRKELMESKHGDHNYSLEELTAEIGSCFLNNYVGLGDVYFENSVSYIDGWLEPLRKDKRFIFYASSRAQRAVDYILGTQSPTETIESIGERLPAELEDISEIL